MGKSKSVVKSAVKSPKSANFIKLRQASNEDWSTVISGRRDESPGKGTSPDYRRSPTKKSEWDGQSLTKCAFGTKHKPYDIKRNFQKAMKASKVKKVIVYEEAE